MIFWDGGIIFVYILGIGSYFFFSKNKLYLIIKMLMYVYLCIYIYRIYFFVGLINYDFLNVIEYVF